MKKYFIRRIGQSTRPHYPFWMPWGFGGCLWRVLLFLFILAATIILLWFLSSIKGCDRSPVPTNIINPIELPDSVPDNIIRMPNDSASNGGEERIPDLPVGQLPPPSQVIQDPEDPIHQISADQLMVIIDPDGKPNEMVMDDFKTKFKSIYPGAGFNIPYANPTTMTALLVVPSEKRESIRTNLPSRIPDISFYIENVEIMIEEVNKVIPNDPLVEETWHIYPILAPEGWTISTGKPEVKVAIIDSYFDLSHPDFNGLNIENPVSFENFTTNVAPPSEIKQDVAYCHGTHVLGIIAGQMSNSLGSTGIAPNVTIMPISLGTNINSFSIMEAILYAAYKGANVINLSLGAKFDESFLKGMTPEQMVEYSRSHGERCSRMWQYVYDLLDKRNIMTVYSSGNENAYTLLDNSKRAKNIIIVDAVGKDLNKTDFSNFANVDNLNIKNSVISAPGDKILSTIPERMMAEMNGTSMAAPIVTAAVALIKSVDPTLANEEIIKLLQETAKPIPSKEIGPLLQIYPALQKVKENRGKWNDFVKNPVGMWKTIEKFPIHNVETNEWTADCHQYIIFESPDSGILELHAVGTDRVWNTRFKATRSDKEVILKFQTQKDIDGNQFLCDEYHFQPDQDNQIMMKMYFNGVPKSNNGGHFVKRLQKDDRRNTNKRNI